MREIVRLMMLDRERIVHGIKTAFACLISLVLVQLVGLSGGQWITITVLILMCAQIYVGSVLQKVYIRFLGTVGGCIFATLTVLTTNPTPTVVAVAMGLSSFVFSYIATGKGSLSYAGTLGATTTAIILLGQSAPTITLAGARFLEISAGILIATLVSEFILPSHVRTHIRQVQAKTLEQLRDYYMANIVAHQENAASDDQALDEAIIGSLATQRQLAPEAKREHRGPFFDMEQFTQTLYYEKETLRAIVFMHRALNELGKIKDIMSIIGLPSMCHFNETVLRAFDRLVQAAKAPPGLPHKQIDSAATDAVKKDLETTIQAASQETWLFLYVFVFAAETLAKCLNNLAGIYGLTKGPFAPEKT